MGVDNIRRAMNAGRRWAMQQMQQGTEVTPSIAEQAATERFQHLGMRHLFIISAIEALFEAHPSAEPIVGNQNKRAS